MAIDIRLSTSIAISAALLGGMAAPAFAINDLAQGYALGASGQTPPTETKQASPEPAPTTAPAKQHAEGKCGEGKCGNSAKPAPAKADEAKADAGNTAAGAKAHAEGKCGEGKCGGSH